MWSPSLSKHKSR